MHLEDDREDVGRLLDVCNEGDDGLGGLDGDVGDVGEVLDDAAQPRVLHAHRPEMKRGGKRRGRRVGAS